MTDTPFFEPHKTFDDNFEHGPFGVFADNKPFNQTGEPRYEFLGHKVYSPFGIPAGPLLNATFMKAAFNNGFDINHYKTQRSGFFPCNPFPNVLFVDVKGDLTPDKAKSPLIGTSSLRGDTINITNSFGNPSRGPDFWQADMKKANQSAKKGQLMIASVVGTIRSNYSEEDYYNDFAVTARLAAETGVKIIEVNLSCPNVADEGILCYTPTAVEQIVKKTKEAIGNISLVIKIGHFTTEQQGLLNKILTISQPYIAGVASINTIPAAVVDEHNNQALPGKNRLYSGICGSCIKWAGIDMTKKLAHIRDTIHGKFSIIGIGGVFSPNDFLDYRNAGADAVQSATGSMWNPFLAQEIKSQF